MSNEAWQAYSQELERIGGAKGVEGEDNSNKVKWLTSHVDETKLEMVLGHHG